MCELSPVTFHGDTIYCVEKNDEPFVPMKPVVENMGLAWQVQARKLAANKDRWGVTIMVIPSESGDQETTCMPLRKLPAFLAGINPKKVKAEIREKVIIYQNECDDALWDYWTKGRAERKPEQPTSLPPTDAPITPDQQCTLQALVKARIEAIPEAERPKGLYPQVWSRFKNHFRLAKYNQLPQTRMSEAVEYLTQMDLTKSAKPAIENKVEAALPPANTIPAPADAAKQLDALHKARNVCRWEMVPKAYRTDDEQAVQRARLSEDLYKLQDCLWAALYNVCSAAAHIRDWK